MAAVAFEDVTGGLVGDLPQPGQSDGVQAAVDVFDLLAPVAVVGCLDPLFDAVDIGKCGQHHVVTFRGTRPGEQHPPEARCPFAVLPAERG